MNNLPSGAVLSQSVSDIGKTPARVNLEIMSMEWVEMQISIIARIQVYEAQSIGVVEYTNCIPAEK